MKQSSVVSQRFSVVPQIFRISTFLLLTACCFLLAAHAQGDEPPKDAAPPPLRIISKEERKMLDAEQNPKKRTELSLSLLETRLKAAEDFAAQDKFQESLGELGSFQALLEDVLTYLERKDDGGSKADNNYKRLEIGLRKIISRLELVRREMPFKYGYYVLRLQKFVREARAKAIEPLFSDSVVPEKKP